MLENKDILDLVAPHQYPNDAIDDFNNKKKLEEKRKNTSILDLVSSSIHEDWIGARQTYDLVKGDFFEPPEDENFRWDKPTYDRVMQGIPQDYRYKILEDSKSLAHAEQIRNSMLEQLNNEEILGNAWLGALPIRLAVGITDPVSWATTGALISAGTSTGAAGGAAAGTVVAPGVGTAAGGVAGGAGGGLVGAAVGFLKHGSKLAKTVKTSLAAGATNAALEATLQATRPISRYEEVAYSALSGVALAGAINAATFRNTKLKPVDESLSELDEKISTAAKASVQEMAEEVTKEVSPAAIVKTGFENIKEKVQNTSFDEVLDKARYDVVGLIQRDKTQEVADLAGLGQDAVGKKSQLNEFAATEIQAAYHDRYVAKSTITEEKFYPKFLEEIKEQPKFYELKKSRKLNQEFREQVTQATRNIDNPQIFKQYHSSIQGAAREFSEYYKDFHKQAQTKGLAGFEGTAENASYVPRMLNRSKIKEMSIQHPKKELQALISGAIKKARPEMEVKQADVVAERYLRIIQESSYGLEAQAGLALRGNPEKIRELLENTGQDTAQGFVRSFSDEQIEETITLLAKDTKVKANKHAHNRTVLDENYVHRYTHANGEVRTLAITDFFENDAFEVFERYSRTMTGDFALADRFGWKSSKDIQEHFRKASEKAQGENFETSKTNLERADLLVKHIKGHPMNARKNLDTTFHNTLKLLRNMGQLNLLNQVVVSMMTEVPNIAARTGIEAFREGFPGFKAMFANIKNGKIEPDELDEWETLFGIGGFRRSNKKISIYEEPELGVTVPDGLLGKAVHVTGRLAAWQSNNVSGMARANDLLHKWAAQSFNHQFMNKGILNSLSKERLLDAGIDEAMAIRIQKMLDENSKTVKGKYVEKKRVLDFDKTWSDLEAQENYVRMMRRLVHKTIQENDPGNLPAFLLRSPAMRTIMQFRSFVFGAHSKMLLNNLRHRDVETATIFLSSLFAGAMTYGLQVHINSIGKENRAKYLKEKLSTQQVAFGAFSKTAWASWLPSILDTASVTLLNQSAGGARSTGNSVGVFDLNSNPSSSFLQALITAGTSPIRAVNEGGFTNKDVNAIKRIIPFQNAFGFSQALKYGLDSSLPKRPKKEGN